MNFSRIILIVTLILLASCVLRLKAERIILKDGYELTADVLKSDEKTMVVDIGCAVLRLDRSEIIQVIKAEDPNTALLSKTNENARWDIVEQGEEAMERVVDLHARASFVKEEAGEMEDRGFERLQEQMRRLEDGIPEMSDEEWKQVLQEAIKSAESLMEAEAVARKGEEKIARALGSWISLAQTTVKEGSAR